MTVAVFTAPAPLLIGDGLPSGGLAPPEAGAPPQIWLVRTADHRVAPGSVGMLQPDEAARRARFVYPGDRHRYTAAHLALRRLLGACLGRDPAAVVITREPCTVCGGPTGRPAVAAADLHFSLSHSGDLALCAVGRTPVGVDIEAASPVGEDGDLRDLLHPRERQELLALAPLERRDAFLRCWTRKEAYLKGTGAGLAHGIDRHYVGTGPAPAVPESGWTVLDVEVDAGYRAAVAFSARASRTPAHR
ncbi:4'-phosphopantetheinyl transferase superfamily protein [Streptomyces sp. NPDC097981]|uniref:4'-phosphopantetheinyl transferase family protein n=1 Tax=Streptomyces sp. NPDC097981 TaxID=3155428 RepID=UPI00331D84A7